MSHFIICIIFCIFLYLSAAQSILKGFRQPCVTPNGAKGTCVEISNCHSIYNIARKHKNYFQRSICGFRGLMTLVCCGDKRGFERDCGAAYTTGNETNLEYPWVVALAYTDGDAVCTGSLINANFVVTAAHCVTEHLRQVQVRDMEMEVVSRKYILKIEKHELYEPETNKLYDIALLRIETVNYDLKNMRWICLPKNNAVLPLEFNVSGYGVANMQTDPCIVQRHSFVKNTEPARCDYDKNIGDLSKIICAGGNGSDACYGNSGGPLMQKGTDSRYTLYGIISYGQDCGVVPGVYTNVLPFLNWIDTAMLKIFRDEDPNSILNLVRIKAPDNVFVSCKRESS